MVQTFELFVCLFICLTKMNVISAKRCVVQKIRLMKLNNGIIMSITIM